jgi:hypothetical protein
VEYKLARKLAEKEYRKGKRVFEEKVTNEVISNPKSFYAYVRSKTSVKEVVALVKDVTVAHFHKCNLINDSQHGFVKGKSCLTNILGFFEDVTALVDKGEPVDVIYLDFQKAFDKVPHRRLMKKVFVMDIEVIFNWIEDWLKSRKQRVCLAGSSSEWAYVSSGVPQDSVLGPLFLIYINDIDDGIVSKILKFADDTKLYGQVGTAEDIAKLTNDRERLAGWSKEWLMLFNVEKCKVMHIGFGNIRASEKDI